VHRQTSQATDVVFFFFLFSICFSLPLSLPYPRIHINIFFCCCRHHHHHQEYIPTSDKRRISLRRFFIAYIDVFIERRSAVVDTVDETGIVSDTKDGIVETDCKGESDGSKRLFRFSDKYFARLEMDDDVEDDADGADFERL
jgi:hypothetical protein